MKLRSNQVPTGTRQVGLKRHCKWCGANGVVEGGVRAGWGAVVQVIYLKENEVT